MSRVPRARRAASASALVAVVLAGCTATSRQTFVAPPVAVAAAAPAQTASLPAPVPLSQARIAFAPLTGAPQPVADVLAEAVARQSAEHGIALAPYGDSQADYTIKGYLSAEPAGAITRAVYVWDVLDRNLKRLHRVSGDVTAPVATADPWAALDPAALDELARQSMAALAAWLSPS